MNDDQKAVVIGAAQKQAKWFLGYFQRQANRIIDAAPYKRVDRQPEKTAKPVFGLVQNTGTALNKGEEK